jgi:hypothetical protein
VALPFLASILLSRKEDSVLISRAVLVAAIVFLVLAGAVVPTRHRAYRQNLTRAQTVLAEAAQLNAKSVILATDSPTLNEDLLDLSSEFSPFLIKTGTMAWQAVSGAPIDDDFRIISQADIVVFQNPTHTKLNLTNQRVEEYEAYVQRTGAAPVRIANDIYVYRMRIPKDERSSK